MTNQERDEAMRETMSRIIDIPCQSGNATEEQLEAHVETTITGVRWTLTGKLAAAVSPRWRDIEDNPPLDREFLGCRVGMKRHDGEPIADMTFHIRGRHIDYAGGPREWTWNGANSGNYGIRLTHWCELPERPSPPANQEHGEG